MKTTPTQKSLILAMRSNPEWVIMLDRQSYTFYFRDNMKIAYTTHRALLEKKIIEQSLKNEIKSTYILTQLGHNMPL